MTKQVPKFTKDTAQLYTCKSLLYNKVTKMYDHTVVNHSVREYITDSISTNTIEKAG
ncbi:ISSpo8 transposase [Streptococcus pneumoniae]|nr:ISSpo8 transposase [Streptococcus pneumoniae]